MERFDNTEAFVLRQARLWGEAAFRALQPPEPFDAGESYGLCAELYRQAIHWALAAHATFNQDRPNVALRATANQEHRLTPLDRLLSTIPQDLLRNWAKDDAHLQRCVHQLSLVDYTFQTSRNEAEYRQACHDLSSFYEAMMPPLVPLRTAVEREALKRNLKLLLVAVVAVMIAAGLWQGARLYKVRRDLALHATWTSSSAYQRELECRSPSQECKEAKGFFFHTRQENRPWFKLDFEKNQRFSSIEVVNRRDCCQERANALLISVSRDGKDWEVVAERNGEFSTFTATFSEVSARYVKIEVPKAASILHLARVRVFP